MNEKQKKMEIVSGDGSELEISPVYEHLNVAKPKMKDKENKIVIPKTKEQIEKERKRKNHNHP